MPAFALNSNIIELTGLTDELAGAYINDAAVDLTKIVDSDGEQVSGASTWPLTMEYVAGSDGNYRAVIAADLPLTPGESYVAHIDADGGTNRVGHWEFPFKVLRRTVR